MWQLLPNKLAWQLGVGMSWPSLFFWVFLWASPGWVWTQPPPEALAPRAALDSSRFVWRDDLRGGRPAVLRLLLWGSQVLRCLGPDSSDVRHLLDRQLGSVQYRPLGLACRLMCHCRWCCEGYALVCVGLFDLEIQWSFSTFFSGSWLLPPLMLASCPQRPALRTR